MTQTDFRKSEEIFNKWKDEHSDIVGFCNWEVVHNNFKLVCFNSQSRGAVIFQIWADGNGFHEYVCLSKVEKAAPELLKACSEYKRGIYEGRLSLEGIEANNSTYYHNLIIGAIKKATE